MRLALKTLKHRNVLLLSTLLPALMAACSLLSNSAPTGQATPVQPSVVRLTTLAIEGSVSDVAFSPDGKVLASSNNYGTGASLILWDWQTGQAIRTLSAKRIYKIAFSPNGQILAALVGQFDRVKQGNVQILKQSNSITLWDVKTGKLLKNLLVGYSPIAFSPDSQTIASLDSAQSVINLWEANLERVRLQLPERYVHHLAFTPNGQYLLIETDNRIQVRDAVTGVILNTISLEPSWSFTSLAISPDSQILAVSDGHLSGTIGLWHLPTGELLHRLSPGRPEKSTDIAISPSEKTLASVSGQWREISEDGRSAYGVEEQVVRLWNMETGKLKCLLFQSSFPTDDFNSVAFSPDGRTLAVGSKHSVKIFTIPNSCLDRDNKLPN